MISPMFAMAFLLRARSIRNLTHYNLSFSKFVQTYYILNLSERIYRHLTVFLTLVTYLQVQIDVKYPEGSRYSAQWLDPPGGNANHAP